MIDLNNLNEFEKECLKMRVICCDAASEQYGGLSSSTLGKALDKLLAETECMNRQGTEIEFAVASEIVRTVKEKGFPHRACGTSPSTIHSFLLGLSSVDPLSKDGSRLYPEMFFGLHGEKCADFSLVFPNEAIPIAEDRLKGLFSGNILKGKREYHWYYPVTEEGNSYIRMLLDKEGEFLFDPLDCDYEKMGLRQIILVPSDMLSELKRLKEETGVSAESIDPEKVDYQKLLSQDDLPGDVMVIDGKSRLRQIIQTMQPKTFAEYLQVEGLAHGTGLWDDEKDVPVENLKEGEGLLQMIAFREDVYERLLSHGYPREEAFRLSEQIRKGKGRRLTEMELAVMREHGLDEQFIELIRKVGYLFSRAHSMEFAPQAIRLLWYRAYKSDKGPNP